MGGGGEALGALLEEVEQQVVELHASAQAEADVAEMRTAMLAVADMVHVLAAGAAVGADVGVDL